ncbi:MAG: methyltransferase domain-containing protein [Methylococcales bacterium]|nr:methyltransferase domain-containing protein [Methylococcales bacterium]
MSIIRKLIHQQVALSKYFDEMFLQKKFLIDGNQDYLKSFLPNRLDKIPVGSTVYDIGCGKNPAISLEVKQKLQANVIGIDLSEDELLQAPRGTLDHCIGADICNFQGQEDGDLLLCQALLEHVPDVEAAFVSCAKGGALIFVPSRNAIFARLNILLPQRTKLFLLHGIFPNTRRDQGFPSFYNRCTPRDFRQLAAQYGFEVEEVRTYYKSSYFSFFFPLYLVWRLWIVLFEKVNSEQAAETFCMALRRI